MWKNIGTIRDIKKSTFAFAQKQICFDMLKDKVQPNQKLMIAISWGADSIFTACLVYNFFLENKYDLHNLFFIHCNHNIRSGNTTDEQFIHAFLEGMQLIVVKRKKSEKGSEAELRKRRYEECKIQAKKYHVDQLIFWHNLTDRIETTFLNLLRGANINGFMAMQEQESHHLLSGIQVLRPVLWLTKNEITDICRQNKIPFVMDPTNNDNTTSLRNKLRNKVLPEVYKLAHKRTWETNSFIESMKNIYGQLQQPKENNILLEPIRQSPHRKSRFAYQRIIAPKRVTNEKIVQVMETLGSSNNITTPLLKERTKFLQENESGYKHFNGVYLFKSHGKIYFIAGPKAFREKTIATQKKISTMGNIAREGQKFEIDRNEYLGAVLRFPNKWDTYKKKTWNERCINQKIQIFQRNFIPIVAKKNQIIHVFRM